MTFSVLELSRYAGQPIGLVRIARGAVVEFYTDADREIELGGDTYLPLAISRTEIRDSSERRKNMVTLTLPVDAPVAAWWRPYPPSGTVLVTWLAMHYGDTEAIVEWTDRVIGPRFTDTILELNCEPSRSGAAGRGLAMKWTRGCPVPLYSQGVGMCNVNRADHEVLAELEDVDGVVLVSPAFATFPTGRLAGGFVERMRPDGELEYRTIMSHTGDTIVLNYGMDGLAAEDLVTTLPGCKHNMADCTDYFDNRDNYAGAIFMPIKSPFDGNPI